MTKTAAELREELAQSNSETRALRRAVKEVEQRELMSAKLALGEAVATVCFADTADAIHVLVQTLNESEMHCEVRRVFGLEEAEDESQEEAQTEPRWGSFAGDFQPRGDEA